MVNDLLSLVKSEIISFNRYYSKDLKVIGLPDYPHTDAIVRDQVSFADWVEMQPSVPVIKVEGIENIAKVRKYFKQFKVTDIHLFVSQKTRYSFKWHKDTVNVYLYVLKGKKRVFIKNKIYELCAGQGVIIPKGHLHRVFNSKNTWALSVGIK